MTGTPIMPATAPQPITRAVWDEWIPPEPASAARWVPDHVVIPEDTETPGPFDLDRFPHCRAVLDAADDPMIRRVYLPWAARLGKTITGLSLLAYFTTQQPRPAMIARENEDKVDDLIENQLYPLLEACDVTRPQLKPPHMRNRRSVDLARARIRRAYSGSPATMAGFPSCYAHASEVSKWSKRKSSEADPLYLFQKRAQLFPFDSFYLYESTPGTAGACNIAGLCDTPGVDVRRRLVPCPHCGEFQQLEFGTADPDAPGIKWKKGRGDRSDPNRAEATAWYQCVNGCKIEDLDRPAMMRAGVWLSEGQNIRPDGTITGRPDHPDAQAIAFGHPVRCPFGSLHSLVISGWGQLAREKLEAGGKREARREFCNQTLGELWDPMPVSVTPHTLAERLCSTDPRAIVPLWGIFLTAGVDVQESGQTFVWDVCAWGPGGQGSEIAHGHAPTFDLLTRDVLSVAWPHADGGQPLYVTLAVIDAGDEAEAVYQLARTVPRMMPSKNVPRLDVEYQLSTLAPEQRRNASAVGDVELLKINHEWTQQWIQRQIEGRPHDTEARFHLSADCAFDLDYLEQLLNEQRIEDIDERGYPRSRWVRRDPARPNDHRDALRLAKVAGSYITRAGTLWDRLPSRQALAEPARSSTVINAGDGRPDGRPW